MSLTSALWSSRWKLLSILFLVVVVQISFLFQPAAAEGPSSGGNQVLCLIVKNSVYGPLEDRLLRWESDKERFGTRIVLKVMSNESAADIRSYLRSIPNLTGCLLVGDIPYVEYEWTYTDAFGNHGYDRFPTDLYYMNLHVSWVDSNGNGAYDKIVGDLSPDIWIGRLKASNLSGNEIQLLKNYFDKDHNYTIGAVTVPQEALLYFDEVTPTDSAVRRYYIGQLAPQTAYYMSQVFPEVTAIYDPKYTNASDYMAKLREPFSLVRTNVHGGATSENFLYNGAWDGSVHSSTLKSLDPNALFYVITSCQNFDYRQRDYIGAWYIFGSHGLFAMGDSSVYDIMNVLPQSFFLSLKIKSLGDAYLTWARATVSQNMNAINVIDYVLLGDPSLSITPNQPLPEFSSPISATTVLFLLCIVRRFFPRKKRTGMTTSRT
jgi:hypothetical protein